ncbi:MAG TPA: phosphotransferase [bacterium]
MLLETHCHTAERSPCSRLPAAQLLRQCLARNLQGAVLTDHHHRWDEEELAALRRDAGVPEHFVLLSGQEVSTADLGHVVVYGAVPSLPEGTRAADIRARHPQAALVRAHPYRHRLEYHESELAAPPLDAVEIFSGNHSAKANSRGLDDWHRFRFTAMAGTDAHGQVPAGTYPTQFDHPVAGIEELAREVRLGRCRPFFKEITRAGANSVVTEVVIGTKGEDGLRPRIILRRALNLRDWAAALRTATLGDEIAARGFAGGRYRLPALLEADAQRLTIIEEGLRGRSLFDRLRVAGPEQARRCLELAAGWLAHLHGLSVAPASPAPFLERERRRLEGYAERFAGAWLPSAPLVRSLAAALLAAERRIVEAEPGGLVQCHGDYHPKNVIIGQDDPEEPRTAFAAAVDLEDAMIAPRAFDVGWFLAHYRHQFGEEPRVLEIAPPERFLADYRAAAGEPAPGFDAEVALFAARADLSIASYLVKLGLGDSAAVDRLLRGIAERVAAVPAGGPTAGAAP